MKAAEHGEALRNLLADLPAGQERYLFHLLTCPSCHQQATDRLGEQERHAEPPDTAVLLQRLEADVPDLLERAGESYAEAEALLAELSTYPAEEQHKALRESRFHSRFLLELLLDRCQAAQPRNPDLAERLAGLAGSLAARLFRHEPESEEESALSQAAAESLAGNARRLLGRGGDAEASFVRAEHCLGYSWGQNSASASFCRFLGLLRWEQGRLDQAEAFLRQAARMFGELEVGQEEAASRVLLGLLHLERERPERAVRLLQAGRAVLDPGVRPWLTVRAGLSAGIGFAELGRVELACAILEDSWRSYALITDDREKVRHSWLEGKLYARLGQRDHAEQLLDAARYHLISEYSLPEAALCTLDLALLLSEVGRGAEIGRLLIDVEHTFSAEPALEVVRRVAHNLSASIAAGGESRQCCQDSAAALRRSFRSRGYRVDGLPFV